MTSAFYESNLQQQRHCVIAKTYESKSFFFYQLSISIMCRFGQVLFQSSVASFKYRCDQVSFRSSVFKQVSFNQLS